MLKSTLNSPKPSEFKRPTLPHLFRSLTNGQIVLFVSPYEGVRLFGGDENFPVEHCPLWVCCWDPNVWRPMVPGESITITVESED